MYKVECSACGATGLYKGFAEPEGHAVVCHRCGGKGYREMKEVSVDSKIFNRRKRKNGIQHVLLDGGTWFSRSGPASQQPKMTIAEFRDRYPE
jgi:uncharacterized radical SAM superfamily protein